MLMLRHLDVEKSIFKDSMNRWRTQSLFIETYYNKMRLDPSDVSYEPLFTLKDHDHQGKPSLKRLYLDCQDPTEYEFATKHLGGWQHWQILVTLKWFEPYILLWREELEVLIRSKALAKIMADAGSDSKTSTQSAKYIADGGYKEKSKRGKSSKAERAKEQAVKDRLAKDSERIGLGLVITPSQQVSQ
jgi:hypothetical protein